MNINIKKLTPSATIPTKTHLVDAGYDLYADNAEPIMIPAHTTVKIPTNIAMEIPVGYWGGVYARSGTATKRGLAPANKVGVIDASYRGNVIVALHNHLDEPQIVECNERIAQLVIIPCLYYDFNEVDTLDNTERGEGGFGSTGVN